MRLIDADALLKRWCSEVCKAKPRCDEDCMFYDYLTIDSLSPTIEPERPSGKWLSHYDYCKRHGYIPSGMMAFWWCDQCEQGADHTTKFCPHCGAKMLREDNK